MKTTVAGRVIEYGVDETTGVFGATWNDEVYKHPTLAGLKRQLETQMKKKPLAVRVVRVEHEWHEDGVDITKGTIVGIHSGNSNLIVRWDGERQTEQVRGGRLLKANVDIAKIKALNAAKKKASKDLNDYLEKNELDAHKLRKDFNEGE